MEPGTLGTMERGKLEQLDRFVLAGSWVAGCSFEAGGSWVQRQAGSSELVDTQPVARSHHCRLAHRSWSVPGQLQRQPLRPRLPVGTEVLVASVDLKLSTHKCY